MCFFSGIYGFEVTRPIALSGIVIHPRSSVYSEANTLASDTKNFNLTAVAEVDGPNEFELLFDLAAILTFCEQQWVTVTSPIRGTTPEQALSEHPERLECNYGRQTTGSLLLSDAFDNDARRVLLGLCLERIRDKTFIDRAGTFRSAFFRHVDTWRQLIDYVDVTYYLDFSAIEMLARAYTGEHKGSAAGPIYRLLNAHGFNEFTQNSKKNRVCSVQTYAHLRNALFHNGKFETTVKEDNLEVTLSLHDYEDYFRCLVPDIFLRVMGYRDKHINWNRWRDGTAFQD